MELSVDAIEEAGLREVLQTPGAALGSWALMDALLARCHEFRFVEPLGRAREVKVALSGLFGRFVARAYLERYGSLRYFAHLGREHVELGGRLQVRVERRPGHEGDLPDWVACAEDATRLTVAEAKGSHAASGPGRAITQARKQVDRVDVYGRTGRLPVKRVAVATRWGMLTDGPAESWIKVHDPKDEGEEHTAEEVESALLGVVRLHMGNLLGPLGHRELAAEIRALTRARTGSHEAAARDRAQQLVGPASEAGQRLRDARIEAIGDAVVGGVVTRAGPLEDRAQATDVPTMARLDLRPRYVGVSVQAVTAAIVGNTEYFRGRLSQGVPGSGPGMRLDAVGEVVRLD